MVTTTLSMRIAIAIAAVALTAVTAGCGEGESRPSGPTVVQRVTSEFGRNLVSSEDAAPLRGHGTVLRLLREHSEVGMSDGGGVVVEIDGDRRHEGEPETTWALNVNGIESDTQPADYRLHPGDVVQWDHRFWYVTLDVRATVGAFPETFNRGVFGRRFPVTVRCARPDSSPCRRVRATLRRAGVAPDGSRPASRLPPRGLPRRAEILVGAWRHWRDDEWPSRIDTGPRWSGVFARFSRDARKLKLLDWYGNPVRRVGAGAGLVAAMRPTEEDLTWLVTGVDDLGVARAARALSSAALRDAFAAVVTEQGVEKVPLEPPPGSEPPDVEL